MFRKLMAGVVLCSVPILSFGVAQIVSTGTAGAATTTTCNGGAQKVTFATPGLSYTGSAEVAQVSTAKTSLNKALKCTGKHKGTGTVAKDKIKTTATTQCSGVVPPPPAPSGCTGNPNDWVYDTVGGLATGAGMLWQEVPTTKWTIGATTYTAANTSSAAAGNYTSGPVTQPGLCPGAGEPNGTELGFVLDGTLTAPAADAGQTTEITVCFLGDSGPGTSNNFTNDVVAAAGGNTAITIASASFDQATSSIFFG